MIDREEFEQLKERVSFLESEVNRLKAEKTVEIKPVVKKPEVVIPQGRLSEDIFEAHSIIRSTQAVAISGMCQKVIGYDSERHSHKHIKVMYEMNGHRYVAFSIADIEDRVWNLFTKQSAVSLFTNPEKPEYAHVVIEGVSFDLAGHIDTIGSWKKVVDEERNLYCFEKIEATTTAKIEAKEVTEKKSLERVIGTKWMGIFASVLIFVAFIMFGASIYLVLTDAIKAAILLFISGVFSAVGLLKVRSESKNNVLWHIVSGCGLGGFYITFLLMNLAFGLIGELQLLILLVLWTGGMIVVAKQFSIVFAYVCYAGVLISTVLCNEKWENSIVGLIFFVVSVVALIATNYQSEYRKNYFWSLQFPAVFIYSWSQYNDVRIHIVLLLVVVALAVVQAHVFDFDEDSDTDFVLYLISNILSFIAILLISYELKSELEVSYLIVSTLALIAMGVIDVNNYISFMEDSKYYLVTYYITCSVVPLLSFGEVYDKYIGLAIFIIPMLIIANVIKNRHALYPVLVYLPIYLFINPRDTEVVIAFIVAAVSVVILAAMHIKEYSSLLKFYLLAFISVSIYWMYDDRGWFDGGIAYCILTVISLVLLTSSFISRDEDETASKVVSGVYNIWMMIVGLAMIWNYSEPFKIGHSTFYGSEDFCLAVIILFVAALFAFNLNFIRLSAVGISEDIAGWMVGVGYSLFAMAVLDRLDAVNYIVSLIFVVMAIAFITIGFRLDVKSVRLYGLIVSMISIVKLIFFDIQYSSSIFYPLGLFVCGGLCLLICWIYNRIERKGEK